MNTSQQHFPVFSAIYSNTYLRRNIHSTYSRKMSLKKSRRVLAAKHKSLVHEHDRRNKLQAAPAIDESEEDALFEAGNSATPIQLYFKELCGGFYPYTWVSEPEMRAMRTIDLMPLLLKLNVIFTATFSLSVLCDALVNFLGSTKPFCEFQKQTAAVKIFVKFRYKSLLKSFL